MKPFLRPLAVGLIACMLSACAARNEGKMPAAAAPEPLSKEAAAELAIGEEINAQILSSFYPYTERRVVRYVNKIARSLAKHAERKDLRYKVTILYNDKIYATSAPGGFIYVTTGMLHFLRNEAEFAAVLGHEIGQLQYRDPKLNRSRKLLDAITRGGAMVGPAFGEIGVLAILGLAALGAAADNGDLTPEARLRRADILALHYMTEAGYDPQGMIDLYHLFVNSREIMPFFYEYYQSRPLSEERFMAAKGAFDALPLEGKTLTTNPQKYQEMTRGVREMFKP